MKFSLQVNMKMPTIVGIFIFISRENFMLGRDEYEKSFITSGLTDVAARYSSCSPTAESLHFYTKKNFFGFLF